jgi:hypothetical protein
MALQRGALIPGYGGFAIGRKSLPPSQDVAEPGLCERVATLRGSRKPT